MYTGPSILYTGPDLGTLILRLYYAESVLNDVTSRRLRHELVLFRTSTVKSDTNLIVGNTSRCFCAFPVMSDTEVSWRVNRQALLPLGAALCARQGLTGLDQVGTVRGQALRGSSLRRRDMIGLANLFEMQCQT